MDDDLAARAWDGCGIGPEDVCPFGPQLPTWDDAWDAFCDLQEAFPEGPPRSVEAFDAWAATDRLYLRVSRHG